MACREEWEMSPGGADLRTAGRARLSPFPFSFLFLFLLEPTTAQHARAAWGWIVPRLVISPPVGRILGPQPAEPGPRRFSRAFRLSPLLFGSGRSTRRRVQMFKCSNICPFVEMLPSKICHLYEIFLFLIVTG